MSPSDPAPQPWPPEFARALAQARDRIRPLGSRQLWYPAITSTNDLAARMADSGAEEGVLIAADLQTAGRGRLGRVWASPAGAGIYASVILRPGAHAAPLMTLAAGVAMAEGIEAAAGLSPAVKWPNDIVVPGSAGAVPYRKLAGILAEAGRSPGPPEGGPDVRDGGRRASDGGRRIGDGERGVSDGGRHATHGGAHVPDAGHEAGQGSAWVVLGFGINVLPAAYAPEIAARATSLETELGRPVDRGMVLAECLAALAARYRELRDGNTAAVLDRWRARAASTFGRRVEWEANGVPCQGIARDIDTTGALLVTTAAGVSRVVSGDVRWM